MIVSEEEAKKKLCQEVFAAGAALTCEGSRCMAWRFTETPESRALAEAEFKRYGRRIAPIFGYCGKAGKPE